MMRTHAGKPPLEAWMDERGDEVVIWEERPRGSDWIQWGITMGVIAFCLVGMSYGVVSAPIPMVLRIVVGVAIGVFVTMLVIYWRRASNRTSGRITVDLRNRQMYIENLRISRGFWPARRTPFYACSFDDITAVRFRRSNLMDRLKIEFGRRYIMIDDVSTDFDKLHRALRTVAPMKSSWSLKEVGVGMGSIAAAILICWACVHFGWF